MKSVQNEIAKLEILVKACNDMLVSLDQLGKYVEEENFDGIDQEL